jgi:hypothetical protein
MRLGKQLDALTTITAAAVALAAPVHADVDTDFANQLQATASTAPVTTMRGWPRSPVSDSATA